MNYEETGAKDYFITPAFDYAVHTNMGFANGRVFYADVKTLGELPESEMAEVREFQNIPDKMRFPQILPVLYEADVPLGSLFLNATAPPTSKR